MKTKLMVIFLLLIFVAPATLRAKTPPATSPQSSGNASQSRICGQEEQNKAVKIAEQLVPLYSSEMKSITPEIKQKRNELFIQLKSCGLCAVSVLEADFWKSEMPEKRLIALYGFNQILREKAVPFFYEGLKDSKADVRLISVYLLTPYKDEKTEDELIAMLAAETDNSLKTLAMASILDFVNSKALATITQYLNDKDPETQKIAKKLLTEFTKKHTQQAQKQDR